MQVNCVSALFLAQIVAIADIYRGGVRRALFRNKQQFLALQKRYQLCYSLCVPEKKNYFAACKYSTYEGKQMKYECVCWLLFFWPFHLQIKEW